jgi:hypothetical protein
VHLKFDFFISSVVQWYVHVFFNSLGLTFYLAGRGKGTPLLRNGIRCIGVELDDESEASDWQGFD